MDDPTMRGYQGWLDEEHKRERKEPGFIVDGGEVVVNPENHQNEAHEEDQCESCGGSGRVMYHNSIGSEITEDCDDCDGPNKEAEELSDPTDCPRCRGVKYKECLACYDCFGDSSDERRDELKGSSVFDEATHTTRYPMSFMAEKKESPPHGKCPGCYYHEYLFNGFCCSCNTKCERK